MLADEERGVKRRKSSTDIVRHDVYSMANALQQEYLSQGPFPHVVVRDLFQVEALRRAKRDAIEGLRADFKETDLFKVFQVPHDLARLEGLPSLCQLRDAVYSSRFRALVERITGLTDGTLSDRVDCSANIYVEGGHLLCHDDCIGSRAVSYVIYLTDETWIAEDGGALELFNGDQCVERVLPSWNSMMLFAVCPGRSFHAVQEVYSADKPRLSVSGWYHYKTMPQASEPSSLTQLENASTALEALDEAFYSLPQAMSEDDLSALEGLIAPEYLDVSALDALAEHFARESSIRLEQVFVPDIAKCLAAEGRAADMRDGLGKGRIPADDAGLRDGWTQRGPVHKRRFLAHDAPTGTLGRIAAVTRTASFRRWLERLAGIRLTSSAKSTVRRFRPGLDYTVAHALDEPPRLDFTCTFLSDDSDDEIWESGDVGGFETYLATDDNDDDRKDVYDSCEGGDDGSDLLSVQAAHNACSIVLRDPGTLRFVKFVSARAPGSRWDIELVHEIHPEDIPSADVDDDGDEDAHSQPSDTNHD